MRTPGSGAAQVVIAVVLLVGSLAPVVVVPGGGSATVATSTEPPEPDFVKWPEASADPGGESFAAVDHEVEVIAKLTRNVTPTDAGELDNETVRVYTREDERHLRGTLPLSAVRSLSDEPGVAAVRIRGQEDGKDARVSPGVATIGAAAVQERGVTGDGVTVGIIDGGFTLTHPAIAGHVSAYQSFADPGDHDHGTAVAAVVADTAPDASLHLAAIGPETSPEEYRRAVEWLRRSGADVILDAGSYFDQPGNGSGPIAEIAANASDDVVFVTSAGNYGRRHWQGTDEPRAGDWVSFADGDTANRLNGGRRVGGEVALDLRWNGSADYDLYLVRETLMGERVVATSKANQSGGAPAHEHVSATVSPGTYHVSVRASGDGRATELELFASHSLEYSDPTGSLLAPATAEGPVVVGAYGNDSVRNFSSRGPAPGGGLGVDVVAPDSADVTGIATTGGTSFAAPYVAGTAALVKSSDRGLSSGAVTAILSMTARDVGPANEDPATGYGVVDARAAVRLAEGRLPSEFANATG